MHTDELRRELHGLASEVAPFEGDAARVRGRVQRRRATIAGALVLALAIPVALGVLRRDGDNSVAATSAKEVAIEALPSRDALLIVPIGGSPDDVRRILDGEPSVVAYTSVAPGRASAFASFPEAPTTDASCPDAGGFVVALRAGSADVSALAGAIGNAATVRAWSDLAATQQPTPAFAEGLLGFGRWNNGVDMEVFMTVDATPEQIAAVQQALDGDPAVSHVEYVDQAAAFEEFKRIFADQPELVESTSADALPVSFRVAPAVRNDTQAIADRLDGVAGIDEVLTPQETDLCD